MIPKLKEAKYVNAYIVWLRFEDGVEGEVDLVPEHELNRHIREQVLSETVEL